MIAIVMADSTANVKCSNPASMRLCQTSLLPQKRFLGRFSSGTFVIKAKTCAEIQESFNASPKCTISNLCQRLSCSD